MIAARPHGLTLLGRCGLGLLAACSTRATPSPPPAVTSAAPVVTPTASPGRAPAASCEALPSDALGGLTVGSLDRDFLATLGAPSEDKGPFVFEAGVPHSTVRWAAHGLAVDLVAPQAPPGPRAALSLTVQGPSALTTACGIGVGSRYQDVLRAYGARLSESMVPGPGWTPPASGQAPPALVAHFDETFVVFEFEGSVVRKLELTSKGVLAGVR